MIGEAIEADSDYLQSVHCLSKYFHFRNLQLLSM